MTRADLWRQSRDQLAAWLPVLLMLLFALATWWLVRSAPPPRDAEAERPPSGGPDYYMRQFSMRSFDAGGQLRSQLSGAEGQHYPATGLLQVQSPSLRFFDRQGRLTVAHALQGQSNADGSEIKLIGQARIVREAGVADGGRPWPRLSFEGEYLHAFVKDERVQSDRPVRLSRGADSFSADRLEYDDKTGIATLQGRVRGILQRASP